MSTAPRKRKYLEFEGSTNFRNRIICSTLSGKPIHIRNIRADDERIGIRDFEASFLRLIERITNGSMIKINNTGTMVKYSPGLLAGGDELKHECPVTRSIGYYLEALVALAPFCKNPIAIELTGVTNDDLDCSVDTLRVCTLPLYQRFGMELTPTIKINKRGCNPLGGGMVYFTTASVSSSLKPIQWNKVGKIKRVRGLAFTARCSPLFATRLIESARGVLNNLLPDVYIHADNYKGAQAGLSSGYGLMLLAETVSGSVFTAELTAKDGGLPEDLGKEVAHLLLEEVRRGGVVDSSHQSLMLLWMCLSPEDVNKVILGQLNQQTITCLREYRDFFGVTFNIKPDESNENGREGQVSLACIGSGYKNFARKVL